MHDPTSLAWDVKIRVPFLRKIVLGSPTPRYIRLAELWHTDPTGDHGPPCGRSPGRRWWRIHVHHLEITIPAWRWLLRGFQRCDGCGKHFSFGYCPVTFQWSGPGPSYHLKCAPPLRRAGGEEKP